MAWYVDDVKISHMDECVVTNLIDEVKGEFGDLYITRGKKHVFLGMTFELLSDGSVLINMSDYIREALDAFPEEIFKSVNTCATNSLFDIDESDKLVTPERADIFHSIVAKLLWVMKRGRPDIELPIYFLCTRVRNRSIKDWEKLKRVLQYSYMVHWKTIE